MSEIEIPYLRIGVSYFKIVERPSVFGNDTVVKLPWTLETIKRDLGNEYIKKIPIFDGSVCFPDHLNFKQVVRGFYNTYHPLSHNPREDDFESTKVFLKHIFGKQFEIGLDYLQILYTKPLQILPIFCLVSTERNTGKSTFLKWLKLIFENNSTYLTNESFTSQFNSDWSQKLLIMLDEVLFSKEEMTERIKNLSTATDFKIESKGVDRFDSEFFGKFVLCSNREDNFIKIDPEEIRFWVRKVIPFQAEDTCLLEKLRNEIPAFIFFLVNREFSTKSQTRMWFTAQQIRTKALDRLVSASRPKIEFEVASAILSALEFTGEHKIQLVPSDIINLLSFTRIKPDLSEIRKLLQKKWKLEHVNNSLSYQKISLHSSGNYINTDSKGRYYTITEDFLRENFDDLMNE